MLARITGVLAKEELAQVRTLLDKAEYIEGKTTAGYRAARVKANLQLKNDAKETDQLCELIVAALRRSKWLCDLTFPHKINRPMYGRYLPGMEYGFHVDNAIMSQPNAIRTDISVTVFLNNPTEYEGGELIIQSPYGEQQVKLNAGDVVIYPTSDLHRVAPVKEGQRLVAVTWIQSFIPMANHREILIDLRRVQQMVHKHTPDDIGSDLVSKIYTNLYRLWCDV